MPKPSTDRAAVQALLRRKRAALNPTTYGLPTPADRRGRRAAGPSQPQMDELLHWADGTYQSIESGRVGDVPNDRIIALGQLLRLSEHEWEMLWAALRGETPPTPLNDCAGREVPAEWADTLAAIVAPAYVNDRSWNVIAHNQHLPLMFPRGEVPANMMRWMLFHPEARGDTTRGIEGVLTDWDTQWAPVIVPQLRAAVAAMPDDPQLAALEADVHRDPRTAVIYERFSEVYVHPDGAIRPIRHATYGPGWTSLCTAMPLAAPRAHLMIALYHRVKPERRPNLRAASTPACDVHAGQPIHAL